MNSKVRKESNFGHASELGGEDHGINSSRDDLESHGEPAFKKPKTRQILAGEGDNGTRDGSRIRKRVVKDPGPSHQKRVVKAEKGKKGKSSKKSNVAPKEVGKRQRKKVELEKNETSTLEGTAANELERYMSSLLEDLNKSRENLLIWMKDEVRKLVAEEIASKSEKMAADLARSKLPLPHVKSPEDEEKRQVQHQKNLEKNNQDPQQQCHLMEHGPGQREDKLEENDQMMCKINLQTDINDFHPLGNFKEDILFYQRNPFRSCAITQNVKSGPSGRIGASNRSKKSIIDCNVRIEDQTDYSQAIMHLAPTENDGDERLVYSTLQNAKSSSIDENVQAQQQKSIVLGIRAQNCTDCHSGESRKGKKIVDPFDPCQGLNNQVSFSHLLGSMASEEEKNKSEGFGYFLGTKSSFGSTYQAASSMHPTLPNILRRPFAVNPELVASSFTAVRPGISRSQIVNNSERSNTLPFPTMPRTYLQGAGGSHSQTLSSWQNNFFSENMAANPANATGNPVPPNRAFNGHFGNPSQVSLESRLQENKTPFGLWLDGGNMNFPGGGYSS